MFIADSIAGVTLAELSQRFSENFSIVEHPDRPSDHLHELATLSCHVAVEKPAKRRIEFKQTSIEQRCHLVGRRSYLTKGVSDESDVLCVHER
jgi:hypothetical protein